MYIRYEIKKEKKPNTIFHKDDTCTLCDRESLRKEKGIIFEDKEQILVKNKYPKHPDSFQTVLIEYPTCEEHLGTYTKEVLYNVVSFALEKWEWMKQDKQYQSVVMFKNHGAQSGASMTHSHMQIVGFYEKDVIRPYEKERFEGLLVEENNGVKTYINDKPVSEFYEYTIMMPKQYTKEQLRIFSERMQTIIRYVLDVVNHYFQSYNLAFYEYNETIMVKIISRAPTSIYLLGYDVHQVPNNLPDHAAILKKLLQDSNNY